MRRPQGGAQWEKRAESFLRDHGLKTLQRNFHCRLGEIDLIMEHEGCLVFAEVRYRSHALYGSGAESVTRSKQQRIIRTAQYYLQRHPHRARQACRFDVISMNHQQGTLDLDWIRDAFRPE